MTPVFRKVAVRMWSDERIARLDPIPKLVWVYVLTGEHTTSLPGLWVAGAGTIAEGLGLRVAAVEAHLLTLESLGLLQRDPPLRVLRVPNAPRYNRAENARVIHSWFTKWSSFPDCPLKFAHVVSLAEGLDEAGERGPRIRDAWATTFGSIGPPDSRIVREPEANCSPALVPALVPASDPESGEEGSVTAREEVAAPQLTLLPTKPTRAPPAELVFEAYVDGWRRRMGGGREPVLTDARRDLVRRRLADGYSVDDLVAACGGVWASPWHVENRRTSFDLVLRDGKHVEQFLDVATRGAPSGVHRVSNLQPRAAVGAEHWQEHDGLWDGT